MDHNSAVCSLDLLLLPRSVPASTPSLQVQPSSAPDQSSIESSSGTNPPLHNHDQVQSHSHQCPTSRLLEDRSVSIVAAINDPLTHNDNPAYTHLAPNHVAEFPHNAVLRPVHTVRLLTRDALVMFRAYLAARHPGLCLDILNTISSVNERHGLSTVYVTARLTHFTTADTMSRESVTILEWKRNGEGSWTCVGSSFVHGYFE